MFKKCSFFIALIAVTACDNTNKNDYDEAIFELGQNEALWSGSYQNSYSFDQENVCLCSGENTDFSFYIDAKGTTIFNNRLKQFSQEGARGIRSIEDVFHLIKEQIKDADSFEINYDEQYGFPSYVMIDRFQDAADDEVILYLSNVVVDTDSICEPVWKPSVGISVFDSETDENISCDVETQITLRDEGEVITECRERVELYNTPISSYRVEISSDSYNTEVLEFDLMSGLCGSDRDFTRNFEIYLSPL